MRIFLSHSSRYKPLVREVKNHFPQHIKSWIDEKDLLVGEEIDTSIKNAIEINSDFVILFLDFHAVRSKWVRQELEWALEQEGKTGRTFIIPVVLDLEAWEQVEPARFRGRKYIGCEDFTEEGIKLLATNLTSQLFAWLSRDLNLARSNDASNSPLKFLDEADRYLGQAASEIRSIVHPYRRENPLSMAMLFDILRTRESLALSSEPKFNELLVRLRRRGCLAGLVCDGEYIFVEEEHYGWKTTVYTDAKQRIARKAVSFIRSRSTLVLDAGSTTIEIARQISRGLKMNLWDNLSIVTNSISAANELLTAASEMGLEDDNRVLQVYIMGGRIRPNTLAVVSDDELTKDGVNVDLSDIIRALNGADMAFVGTNGIYRDLGFTTHDMTETKTKAAMLSSAKRKLITADPSKFGMRQENVFATFDQGIEIITIREGDEQTLNEYESLLKETSTKIIYA